MNRYPAYFSSLAIFLVTVVIAIPACQQGSQKDTSSAKVSEPPAKVQIADVTASSLNRDTELAASIEGYETAKLVAKIDGYVGKVNVDIGDLVEKGQLLAVLNVPELEDAIGQREAQVEASDADIVSHEAEILLVEAERDTSQAALKLRQLEHDRFESLVEKGSLNQQRLDEASFAVRAAEANLKQAQAKIKSVKANLATAVAAKKVALSNLQIAKTMASYREIKAPFNGLITARMVDPGAYVRPTSSGKGTDLFNLARVDKLKVIIYLPLELARYLNKGDTVTLHDYSILGDDSLSVLDGKPLTISRIANAFDKGSRMMRAEIDIDNHRPENQTVGLFKPGDYGKLTLRLESLEGQPMVPRSALGTESDGREYVIVLGPDGMLSKTLIDGVVVKNNDFVVIDSDSVGVGDRVVAGDLEKAPLGEPLKQDRIEDFSTE